MIIILLLTLFLAIVLLTIAPQLRSMASTDTERFAVDASFWHEAREILDGADIQRHYEFYSGRECVFDVSLDDAQRAADLLGLVRK